MVKSLILLSPKRLQYVKEAGSSNRNNNAEFMINCFSYKFQAKRLFLPFIGCMGLVVLPIFQTYSYLPFLVFIASFIIFWNFPWIITFMNSKPLYYEDLFIAGSSNTLPEEINPIVKQKFEHAFEWSLIFTNSVFTAALSEYWLYQTGTTKSYVEIVGVTGGILKIFQAINHMNGGIILHITRSFIDKELNNASSIQLEEINTENKNIKQKINLDIDNQIIADCDSETCETVEIPHDIQFSKDAHTQEDANAQENAQEDADAQENVQEDEDAQDDEDVVIVHIDDSK